jgi:DNA-binding FadR family transcriptional regulator
VSQKAERLPEVVATALRRRIADERLSDGAPLGRLADLAAEFDVSRPSIREALRILEAQGMITVAKGARGGVVVREPDEQITARAIACVLQSRGTSLCDVLDARCTIEAAIARAVAASPEGTAAAAFRGAANDCDRGDSTFRRELIALTGNQTLRILTATLDAILDQCAAVEPKTQPAHGRLVRLIGAGASADAKQHGLAVMDTVARTHEAELEVEVVVVTPPPG